MTTTAEMWNRAAVRNISATTAEADALAAHRRNRHAPRLWPLALCVAAVVALALGVGA